MSQKPNCTLCHWAVKMQLADQQGKAVIGKYHYQCQRMPPTAIVIQTPQGIGHGAAFPVVTAEHVCSLYQGEGDQEPAFVPNVPLMLNG